MKKVLLLTYFTLVTIYSNLNAQAIKGANIDALLIQGEYNEVVNNCMEFLKADSLNAELHFKIGIAYQNLMQQEKALNAISKAISLAPDSKKYIFTLAKYYYNVGKLRLALPLFADLCSQDSTNWLYTYYLTDIYMQKGLYAKALPIYCRFYKSDSTNTAYIDKYAFCNLRLEMFDKAIFLYEKSLKINSKNTSVLKNLSYLYLKLNLVDTAIYQLNRGIQIDSTDFDFYNRRGDIYFSQNLHLKAGFDYHKVLNSGDSSKTVLKKLGIGLLYNMQNLEAIDFLKLAYKKDSSDFETASYLGQAYYNLKQYKKSITFYNKVLTNLSTFAKQIDYTHVLIADTYKDSCLYSEAILHYTKSLNNKYSARVCMTIANIYDEDLNNPEKAIYYYQLFLNNIHKNEFALPQEYIDNTKKRLEWLKKKKNNPKNT